MIYKVTITYKLKSLRSWNATKNFGNIVPKAEIYKNYKDRIIQLPVSLAPREHPQITLLNLNLKCLMQQPNMQVNL